MRQLCIVALLSMTTTEQSLNSFQLRYEYSNLKNEIFSSTTWFFLNNMAANIFELNCDTSRKCVSSSVAKRGRLNFILSHTLIYTLTVKITQWEAGVGRGLITMCWPLIHPPPSKKEKLKVVLLHRNMKNIYVYIYIYLGWQMAFCHPCSGSWVIHRAGLLAATSLLMKSPQVEGYQWSLCLNCDAADCREVR